MVLDRLPGTHIAEVISAEWGVSPRSVRKDIERIRKRWKIEDEKAAVAARSLIMRRIDRAARIAEANKDVAGMLACEALAMKLLPDHMVDDSEVPNGSQSWASLYQRALAAKAERDRRPKPTVTIDGRTHAAE